MKPSMSKLVPRLVVACVVSLYGTSVSALPRVGSDRPSVMLHDAWDRPLDLARYRAMPTLVFYEDKDSAAVNRELKDALAQLGHADPRKPSILVVAIADVSGYDYWPARGFVKSAIQSESRKQKTNIYCDWDGHVRGALDVQRGTSNVVLLGKNGKVLFSHAGFVPADKRGELMALLKQQSAST